MQQLLALPRGSVLPAARLQPQHQDLQPQQQQQQVIMQRLQNDLHLQMQQEAREHLKQQQHQKQSRQQQQQLVQEQLLWGNMQNIAPMASSTTASSPATNWAPNAEMNGVKPSTIELASVESNPPSALSPKGKRSGSSSACVVS
jgi:hypothetical protein